MYNRFYKNFYVLAFVIICLFAKSQPLHEYFFNNNLNGTAGGPTLNQSLACSAAAGAFGTQTITTAAGTCSVATVFCFNQGGGLSYPNPSYITNQYSINLFFEFSTISGWSRIIDFSNSTADAGFYLLGNCLNFYPNGNVGTCPFFNPNIYYLFTFVRNGATNIISVYVNGTLFGTYNDAGGTYRCATNTTPIIFFRDDNVVQCEAKPGCVKYMSITSATTSAAQVATTWTNICSVVLPIELGTFEATSLTNQIDLNWTTLTEHNNKLFEIERGTDAVNFTKIGEMKGAENSNHKKEYLFHDIFPKTGINYYRLKQIDFDGAFKYSTIVFADYQKTRLPFHPNPTNSVITIDKKYSGQSIYIKNTLGQDVLTINSVPENGELDLSDLSFGIYFFLINNECYKLIISK